MDNLTVLIQGFGAVGAHAARILSQRMPGAKVIGISDIQGYLFEENGLPVERLFNIWQEGGQVTWPFYKEQISISNSEPAK